MPISLKPLFNMDSNWIVLQEKCSHTPWSCKIPGSKTYTDILTKLELHNPFSLEQLKMPASSTVLFFGTSMLAEVVDNLNCVLDDVKCVDFNRSSTGLSRTGAAQKCSLPRNVKMIRIFNEFEFQHSKKLANLNYTLRDALSSWNRPLFDVAFMEPAHRDGWFTFGARVDLKNPSRESAARDNATFALLKSVSAKVIEVRPWSWQYGEKNSKFRGSNGLDLDVFTRQFPCQGDLKHVHRQCSPDGSGHQCTVGGVTLAALAVVRRMYTA